MRAVNWIASYPKSGNTWLRFMLASYLTKEPVTSVKTKRLNALIPAIGGMAASHGPPAQGPVIFKTHALPSASAVRPYLASTRRAIYLVRNPRDVMLSLLRHSGAEPGTPQARDFGLAFVANYGMPALSAEFEWGNWPQSVQAWTDPAALHRYFPNGEVLPVRYEDMRADPAATLYKILDFLDLGQPVAMADVTRAVETSALEKMRDIESRQGGGQATREDGKLFRARGQFAGRGLHNQSLAHLGDDVEEKYQELFQSDNEFSGCARQFGYHA
jgi:sulfotransferase family protein